MKPRASASRFVLRHASRPLPLEPRRVYDGPGGPATRTSKEDVLVLSGSYEYCGQRYHFTYGFYGRRG